jgi:hypothetical protein
VFVALGIATTEAGVLFGLVPIAVGGVLVFGGSCAGMAREAGYTETVWRSLRIVGGTIGFVSVLLWGLRSTALTPESLLRAASTDAIALRAVMVLIAATVLVASGYVGSALTSSR